MRKHTEPKPSTNYGQLVRSLTEENLRHKKQEDSVKKLKDHMQQFEEDKQEYIRSITALFATREQIETGKAASQHPTT